MANNRMTEGVGKKIVEALKMQTDEVDVAPINTDFAEDTPIEMQDSTEDFDFNENDLIEDTTVSEDFESEITSEDDFSSPVAFDDIQQTTDIQQDINLQPSIETPVMPINNPHPQPTFNNTTFETPVMPQVSTQNIDEFEVPSNVAVLKQLISKLPAGVTKQTGALIIKQTMEALGISMRSVLQEAQQVQEGLNNSTRECQASIAEYKRQIGVLEKQAQKYQRQYAALNDIISLFVQTNF